MSNNWLTFWNMMDNPAHTYNTDEWFDKYSQEILFYIKDSTLLVDTGCGSGEVLIRLNTFFKKIIAIDFSQSMINAAHEKIVKNNISNIDLYCANMLDIDTYVTQPVDCIYNNGVIQYLTLNEIEIFFIKAHKLLNSTGKLVIMNIPDRKCFDLYAMQFFKTTKPHSFYFWIIEYIRFKLWIIKQKMKNEKYQYNGDIGTWISIDEITAIATKTGFTADITYSMYLPYGYRFHAVLKKI